MSETKARGARVGVTFDAMIQRLVRTLVRDNRQTIRSPRGRADRQTLGDYYVIDLDKNVVVEAKLSRKRLVEMAREMKVITDWEEVR
jgi:hypothetical protein